MDDRRDARLLLEDAAWKVPRSVAETQGRTMTTRDVLARSRQFVQNLLSNPEAAGIF